MYGGGLKDVGAPTTTGQKGLMHDAEIVDDGRWEAAAMADHQSSGVDAPISSATTTATTMTYPHRGPHPHQVASHDRKGSTEMIGSAATAAAAGRRPIAPSPPSTSTSPYLIASSSDSRDLTASSSAMTTTHHHLPRRPVAALRRFSSSSFRSSGGATVETTATGGSSVMTVTTSPTEDIAHSTTAIAGGSGGSSIMGGLVGKGPGGEPARRYSELANGPFDSVRSSSEKGKERAHWDEERYGRGRGDLQALSKGLATDPPDFSIPTPSPASIDTKSSAGPGGVTFELSTFPPSYRDSSTRPDTATTTSQSQHSQISSVGAHSASSRTPLFPTDEETRSRLALLGYSQELNRDWDLWSSISLTVLNLGTVQGSCWGLVSSMISGGPVVMSTGPFAGALVFLSTIAVLGEFASAFPVAGAMFTWVFKLARASKPLRDWARFFELDDG